ncbi:MAG: hypothetical protein WAW37_04340 [Syntrophobacteraceae bacterium]
MKRGIFIGSGIILLMSGVAGLALLPTDLLNRSVGTGTEGRLEAPPPVTPEIPGKAEQAGVEGKLPAPPDERTSPSAKAGPGANDLSGKPPGPRRDLAAPKPQEPARIPPTLKGERGYPGGTQPGQPPQPGRQQAAKPAQPGQQQAAKPAQPGRQQAAKPPQLGQKPGAKPGTGPRGGGPGAYSERKGPPSSRKQVTVRFRYDPARDGNIKVARVHLGDRVDIKVRRVGRAERQLYLGFDLPERTETRSYPFFGQRARKTGTVITPVQDNDRLTLNDEDLFGAALSRKLDSLDGAVLKLGAKPPRRDSARSRAFQRESGRYEVEVTIYAGNRWNLKPRSF